MVVQLSKTSIDQFQRRKSGIFLQSKSQICISETTSWFEIELK